MENPNEPTVLLHNVIDLKTVFETMTIVEQICHWNSERYEQKHDDSLTLNLLLEELGEIKDAMEALEFVEVLDGYADVFYVCIGAMWKQGLSAKDITDYLDVLQANEGTNQLAYTVQELRVGNLFPRTLGNIALSCIRELGELLHSEEHAFDVIRAVCISNDTKRAEKVPSHLKANVDKGVGYIPPTDAICKIVEKAFKEVPNAN